MIYLAIGLYFLGGVFTVLFSMVIGLSSGKATIAVLLWPLAALVAFAGLIAGYKEIRDAR